MNTRQGIEQPPAESSFTNDYGERFLLRVDTSGKVGQLFGDEISWEAPIEIRDDRICADFILGDAEWAWLSESWRKITGRALHPPLFTRLVEIAKELAEIGYVEG